MKQITQVGGFTWDLFFDWKELPQEQKDKRTDVTEPLKYYLQVYSFNFFEITPGGMYTRNLYFPLKP